MKRRTVAELNEEQRRLYLAIIQPEDDPPKDRLLLGVVVWVAVCVGLAVLAARYGAF